MLRAITTRLADFVTTHNRIVILLTIIATGAVMYGVVIDQGAGQQQIDDDALGETEVFQAAEYIDEHYGDETADGDVAITDVYVLEEDGSVLTQAALLEVLEFQKEVRDTGTVGDVLAEDGITGPPNLIGATLAGDPGADLETQYDAIADASESELQTAVTSTFTGGEETRFYLPSTYEVGDADAEAMRLTIAVTAVDDSGVEPVVSTEVQETIYETTQGYDSPAIYTTGNFAWGEFSQVFIQESLWLVLPPIFLVLIVVLGFAYRDLTDVLLGFIGTALAVAWTYGLMGWMGILTQDTAIIAPVLIAALSIDFGFHVFMRYRERRGPGDGIRAALSRSTAAVAIAFALVTITAAIGFLSNITNPVPSVRNVGVAVTLGVISALIVFTTFIPALKVSADGLWERFGFERNKTALGKGRYLRRILGSSVAGARQFAVPIIVIGLVLGLAGGLAFTELDREPFQDPNFDESPGWAEDLPGPMAFEAHESEPVQQLTYAQSHFQPDQEAFSPTGGGSGFTQFLIEGENGVATADALAAVDAAHEAAETADDDIVLRQGEEVHVISPLSAMQELAAADDSFAATFEEADTTGNEIPDTDVAEVFDEFYDTAPEQAATILERTDEGEYASMMVQIPTQGEFGSDRAAVMYDIADQMEGASGHEVTPVGAGTINDAEMSQIADGVVQTMILAMLGVLVTLAFVYRFTRGSATLGVLTVLPIALTLGLVFGGMYLIGQPLTLLTALLVSIVIGLGIDYNIHLSDRFVVELERGHSPTIALREAVTGTGGALLGSAVTSGGAFGLLILIPHPQFASFGVIVALALATSFIMSVGLLPSLLWLWSRSSGSIEQGTRTELAAEAD